MAPPSGVSGWSGATRRTVEWIRIRPWGEVLAVGGLLLLVMLGYLFKLKSVVFSDMDEGTYLYAGKLVSEGMVPYRDFFLAHPPLIVLLAGGWIRVFGDDVMAARAAYIILVLAGAAPLYLITRSITRSRAASLLSIAVYTTGMLFLANMGRTVRLEPLMNAFLIPAFALWLLRPNSPRARGLAGVLVGLAVLVKLVAGLPVIFLLLGELLWGKRDRRLLMGWAATIAGGAVVLVPAGLWLLSLPDFFEGVVRLQMDRPSIGWAAKLAYVRQDFLRYPAIPVALAVSAWLIVKGRDPLARTIALVSLGGTAALVLSFKTFFGYYLVQELPWLAVIFAVFAGAIAGRVLSRWAEPLLAAGAVVIGLLAPIAYGQVYAQHGDAHVSSPARVVAELKGGEGYLYTMYPSLALASGRELYPWHNRADSLVPRITGRIGDEDFVEVFGGSRALVLWPDELHTYPKARAYVEANFRIAYQDPFFTVWLRNDGMQ